MSKIVKNSLYGNINIIDPERDYIKLYDLINKILLQFKFNVSSIGFDYWIIAIMSYKRNRQKNNNSIENIYEEVATINHTNRHCVERAMRTARREANNEIRQQLNYDPKSLTNKKVLVLLEQILRKEMEQE